MIDTVATHILAPWQPAIREDWHFDQIKYHYDVILGKMLQNSAQSSDDIEVPYLKAQHVQWDRAHVADLPTMWASPGEIEVLQIRKGDLVVCEGGEVGRAAIVAQQPPETCIIQNALHLVRPKPTGDVRFLRYLLQHATSHGWLDVLCNRATIAHFTAEKFREMWVWLPPCAEQRSIADYLDRETAKIDTLIAAKQRLLDLLVEKRRTLITHAVTRGLDANAPLRDSGVEWLGKIPAHWATPPVYTRFEVQLGKMLDEKRIRSTHLAPYLRNGDVQWGYVNIHNLQEMDFDEADRRKYALQAGDILVCEGGELGRTAIWHEELKDCYFQKAILRLRPTTQEDIPEFFVYVMYMLVKMEVFSLQATNATIQHLPAETLRRMRYAAPPFSEQHAIVNYLEQKVRKLDALSTVTSNTIELLHERRTALIAAVVTGKLDVRI